MNPRRRRGLQALLSALLAAPAASASKHDADDDRIAPLRVLRFPRDHGAHPGARIEWWYATGWLGDAAGAADAQPRYGFQLTFFRSRSGLADDLPGRLAPRQLLFGHAALTDLGARRHRHAQRLARWSGRPGEGPAQAARADTALQLGAWQLQRLPAAGGAPDRYRARLAAPEAGFTLALELATTQPLLLQGAAGYSRKGPLPAQASHYYTQPQLAVAAQVQLDGRRQTLAGRAWLDHEWSDELLAADAAGWDWCGINLADGSTLTAFQLHHRDGRRLWAGGSWRGADGRQQDFAAGDLQWQAERAWTSPDSGARYPVRWALATPAGRWTLEALLDAQELDSRASTGAIYWEGLAELRDAQGRRVGLGYLEMTGRASPLRLS